MSDLRRLPARTRAHLTHRLALFLRSGVPIVTALSYLCAEREARVQSIVERITAEITAGTSLATAVARHERAFSPLEIALIRVGEAGGRLQENLAYAAELIEQERAMRARLMGALAYPALVLLATVAIVLFLLLYAFPKILPLFRGLATELPLSTRLLIGVTDALTTYWPYGLAAFVLGVLVLTALERRPAVRLRRQYAVLAIPVLGSILRAYELSMLGRVLGTLVRSGVGLVPALELAEAVARNDAYRSTLARAREAILRGKRLSLVLSEFPLLFPTLAVQIIATGELTGNLAESLLSVADVYDAEVRERTERITVLIEPALMLITGLIVGFIALSIITPIYEVTQGLAS